MCISAVGIYRTVVVTIFEVLFPVFVSNVLHVIVAKFDNIQPVTFTVQVMITFHAQPLNRFHTLYVNTFHEMIPVEATNHVNQTGNVSVITTPVAVAGQALA
jgi:hypothetical protein